jgi:hypothetical protein
MFVIYSGIETQKIWIRLQSRFVNNNGDINYYIFFLKTFDHFRSINFEYIYCVYPCKGEVTIFNFMAFTDPTPKGGLMSMDYKDIQNVYKNTCVAYFF